MGRLQDRIKATTHVITHDNCADGTASALFLCDAFPKAEITLVQYGTPLYRGLRPQDGAQYLFCDMSPNAEQADAFRESGAVILDHHLSQKDLIASFGELGVYADEKAHPGVSGAVLAYEHVWLPLVAHERSEQAQQFAKNFATLSGVYDTWQRQDANWQQALELVRVMHFQSPSRWLAEGLDRLAEIWPIKYEWMGPILVDKSEKSSKRTFEGAERMTTERGTRIMIINGLGGINNVVDMAGNTADLVLAFVYEVQGGVRRLVCSTRSHAGYDCAALARRYGGGGHKAAAGFSTVIGAKSEPYKRILNMIENFESDMAAKEAKEGSK